MPVRVRCPGCESLYKLGEHLAGKTVRCKGCSQIFKVPGFAGVSAPEVPPEKPAAKAVPSPQPTEHVDDEETLAGVVEDEQQPSLDTDDEPVAPAPRGKSKKAATARKRKPVPMLALVIVGGVVVLIGGGLGAYFLFFSGPSAKTAQAPPAGKGASQPNISGGQPGKGKGSGKAFKGGKEAEMEPSDPAAKAGEPLPEKDISFVAHVKPFLNKYCIGCHGAKQPKAGISFASYDAIMRGGKKSGPIIVPGDADQSEIVLAVEHKQDHRPMPPPKEKRQPTAEEKTMLRTWVTEGAKDDSTKTGAVLWNDRSARTSMRLRD